MLAVFVPAMMREQSSPFTTTVEITPNVVRVLVTEPAGDVLKAELRAYPGHPRALISILEGLALWSGHRLCVAIAAEYPVSHSLGLGFFGDEWPETNALVDFLFIEIDDSERRKIGGVGDFRKLRRIDRERRGQR